MSSLSQLIADLPASPPPPQSSPPPPFPRPELRLSGNGPPTKPPAYSWEEAPAFREIFLVHFPPLAAEAFRDAGRHLYDAALEHDLSEPAEPWLFERVRAVAADLRFGAEVLASLCDTPVYAGVTQGDLDLAVKMGAWAGEAQRLAAILEAAVGPVPEPEL